MVNEWKACNIFVWRTQVDFTEPRIITGIVTKGISSAGKTGEAWTEAYRVVYSNDLTIWNKILDSDSEEKVSMGDDGERDYLTNDGRTVFTRLEPRK